MSVCVPSQNEEYDDAQMKVKRSDRCVGEGQKEKKKMCIFLCELMGPRSVGKSHGPFPVRQTPKNSKALRKERCLGGASTPTHPHFHCVACLLLLAMDKLPK